MTTALITGVNGQDGSYLAELLLSKGYTVYGTVRSKNPKWPYGFDVDQPNLHIFQLDLGYPSSFDRMFQNPIAQIDECYNLAAQSHVGDSFVRPEETYAVTGQGACMLMDAYFGAFPQGKFYQASTSELFGNRTSREKLNIGSEYSPASPYAVAKLMAHQYAGFYRERGFYAVAGILFNHESERRHASFLTQKVCIHAAQVKVGKELGVPENEIPKLHLGNLTAYRDWGYAPQYVEIMWRLMQREFPSASVIGTGVATQVKHFVEKAYGHLGLDWTDWVVIDNSLIRPLDVDYLCADSTLANKLLGDRMITVDKLIPIMINHQMVQLLKNLTKS